MDQSLSGKARAAAKRRQKKWRLSPDDWDTLAKLCAVLQVSLSHSSHEIKLTLRAASKKFQDATLEFSRTKTPTITKVLPLFKMIQQHLEDALKDPDLSKDKSGQKYRGLKRGLQEGLSKIKIHLDKALVGDYPLLGAGECFGTAWPN
jgi:hypothetical protein